MFYNCLSLLYLPDISNLDLRNPKYMEKVFVILTLELNSNLKKFKDKLDYNDLLNDNI